MVAELEGATDLVDLTGRVKQVFDRYRSDERRTFLTRPEMQRMLNELVPNTSYKNLDKMLKEIDGEGADGKFTTPEFVDWLVSKVSQRQAQRVVLRAIVEATGDSLGARVMEMFDRYDLDGSAFLERHELMKVLRVLDSEITTAEIQRPESKWKRPAMQFKQTSSDQNTLPVDELPGVSYKEFLVWLGKGGSLARKLASKLKQVTGPVREKRVRDAFTMYDVSGDGFLDISELRNAMGKMFLFNQEEVNKICADLDTSNDGVISYKEFATWMRKGSSSKEVLKGKTILAPIDSDGLDAVFYVFCGPGKTEMEMKDFVKFCKNCKFVDSTLPPAVAELVFNDHRVKPLGRRTIDFFEFAVALEILAERRNTKVGDLHTVALLTGGPQAQLKGAVAETAQKGPTRKQRASRVAKQMKPILEDKDGWKRDVDNGELWKKFGIGTSAGRCLRQIYGPADVSLPPPPARADQGLPQVHRSSINLHKIRGSLEHVRHLALPKLPQPATEACNGGLGKSLSLPALSVVRTPCAKSPEPPAQ
ncbi:CPK24 [Symbiodinium pilosum]|uniref:CPK24 protein n=1 Tax=Symbiodinium pilosum TaxID=2952 RepID=A0A812PB97_SYMPI|nr:CPK24 [Symbiodinium pilosum]